MIVSFEKLIQDNLETLRAASDLLERLAVAAQANRRINPASIGPHLRHILDHYDAFLNGAEGGVIDYDQRDRCKQTELSPAFAKRRIQSTTARLRVLAGEATLPSMLKIRLCTDSHCEGEVTVSSPARELQFLQSHCVHHFAMMRRILSDQGLDLEEDFGKAPATLSYERASAQAS